MVDLILYLKILTCITMVNHSLSLVVVSRVSRTLPPFLLWGLPEMVNSKRSGVNCFWGVIVQHYPMGNHMFIVS